MRARRNQSGWKRGRHWSAAEDRVLHERFATTGAAGCLPLLPGRDQRAVMLRTRVLGLRSIATRIRKADSRSWTAAEDAALREHYPQLGAIGCAAMLARRSRAAISTRAWHIGLRVVSKIPAKAGEVQKIARLANAPLALPPLEGLDYVILGWTARRTKGYAHV